ncbi:unnamed protein product [Danaus chrysippus]|uniref:(African queen) hypothetical protein n=1 Tax=Danaus chrysippus TaxID=151541 RepID=A0A8J2W1B4_9NEOP|nr:unnamed protein product [Danaus chrysippus]
MTRTREVCTMEHLTSVVTAGLKRAVVQNSPSPRLTLDAAAVPPGDESVILKAETPSASLATYKVRRRNNVYERSRRDGSDYRLTLKLCHNHCLNRTREQCGGWLTRLARRREETCADADTKDPPPPYRAGTEPRAAARLTYEY